MTAGAGPARTAAFRILRDVEAGEYADRAAERRLAALPTRDRALSMELAFGTIRLRGRLDHELGMLVHRPLGSLQPELRAWLRLGLYQLRETRVPDHAAVHETVSGARRSAGRRAAGMVNAVLRRAGREGRRTGLFATLDEDPVAHLRDWGSHPEWLVRRWLGRWPPATVAALVERDNRAPPVILRTLGPSPAAGAAAPAAGLEPVDGHPGSWRLNAGDPADVLRQVPSIVQDPAASAVVEYVGAEAPRPRVDLCAAPGGKAALWASLAPPARPLLAADVSAARLGRVRETVRRTGVPLVVAAMDARRPAVNGAGTVLLDAPCTGTGVLARRADARWRVNEGRLGSLVELQRQMLAAAADVVAPGGLLVYATCSLEPEENELRVEAFLEARPEFRREPGPPEAAARRDAKGDLRMTPWQHGFDGAYACRMRKDARA